jgi:hypothetical protein
VTDSVPTTAGVAGSALTAEEATARNRKLEGELISVMRDLASAKRDYELDVQALKEATEEDKSAEEVQELQKTKDSSFKRLFVLEASRQDINDDRRSLLEVVRAHTPEDDASALTKVERMIAALDLVTNSVYTPELRSFYVTELAPTTEVSAEDQAAYAALLEDVDFAPRAPTAPIQRPQAPTLAPAETTPPILALPKEEPVAPAVEFQTEAHPSPAPLLRRRDRRRGRPEEAASPIMTETEPEAALPARAPEITSSPEPAEEPLPAEAPRLRSRRAESASAPVFIEEPLVEPLQDALVSDMPVLSVDDEPFTLNFDAAEVSDEDSVAEASLDFLLQEASPAVAIPVEELLVFADDDLAALIEEAPEEPVTTPPFETEPESKIFPSPALPILPPIGGGSPNEAPVQRRKPNAGGVPIAPLRRRGSGILPTAPVGGALPAAPSQPLPAPQATARADALSPEALRKAQELQSQADEEREAHRQNLAAEAAARMAGGASSHPFREEGGAEEAFAQPLPQEVESSQLLEEPPKEIFEEPAAIAEESGQNFSEEEASVSQPINEAPNPVLRRKPPAPGGSLISRLLRRQEQEPSAEAGALTRRTFRRKFVEKLPETSETVEAGAKEEIRRVISAAEPVRRVKKKKTTTNDFLRLLGEEPQEADIQEDEEEIDYTFDLFGSPLPENEESAGLSTSSEPEQPPLELYDLEELDLFGAAATLPTMVKKPRPAKSADPSPADFAALIDADGLDPEEVPEVINFLEGDDSEHVSDDHAFITDDDDDLPADFLEGLVDDDELTSLAKPTPKE